VIYLSEFICVRFMVQRSMIQIVASRTSYSEVR